MPGFRPMASSRAWLAGAASLTGVNDSQWRTDLWLYNPTESPIDGEAEFVVGDDPSQIHTFGWPSIPTLSTNGLTATFCSLSSTPRLSRTALVAVLLGVGDHFLAYQGLHALLRAERLLQIVALLAQRLGPFRVVPDVGLLQLPQDLGQPILLLGIVKGTP